MSETITDPQRIHAVLDRHILPDVEQPGQYVGGEVNSVRKDPDTVDVSLALCFPDLYTVGMAHLGYQILYSIVNSLDWALAQRAYVPLPDMQRRMREHGIPLHVLESYRPVKCFDVVGFSLQSELLYTNVLTMLDLGGIPLESALRGQDDPIVIAGGPGAMAPEPMARFIDLFFVGDGEDTIVEFLGLLRALKAEGAPREEMILRAARSIPGLYAPAFYEAQYAGDGSLRGIRPVQKGLPERIRAARVRDLNEAPFPEAPIVPLVEAVHDRITLEIMRGCTRGCRFCQAGMIARPTRHRSVDRLCELARASYGATGHNEIALASLSSSDYPDLEELLERITAYLDPLKVNVSLPSLRITEQLRCLVGPLSSVRKSGLTLAPEVATERLRAVINKDVSNEELFEGTRAAARQGWRLVKLYFMIGLPTETEEDAGAIPGLCEGIVRNSAAGKGESPLRLNVTISPFVPKPHTPFQWEPMASQEQLRERIALIRRNARSRRVRYKFHDERRCLVEAVLARGDRRLGRAVRRVWERGGQFDAWDEHFSFERWMEALSECGVRLDQSDPNSPLRARSPEEVLPWDHIDCGVKKEYLLQERERALRSELTPDCREAGCKGCGACGGGDSSGEAPHPEATQSTPSGGRADRHACRSQGRG